MRWRSRCWPTRAIRKRRGAAGRNGRARIEREFSLEAMLGRYRATL